MSETTVTPIQTRRTVPLGALRIDHRHWSNPRTFTGLDEDSLDELAKNIQKNGIEVPLHVVQVKYNGDVVDLVIDGQRRYTAGLRVLPKTHPVEVIDLESSPIELTPAKAAELMRRALNIGANREGLSSYEISEAAENLRKDGLKLSEISRAINKSETWISKMLTAREHASPKLMLSWKKGEITDEQFKDLAKEKGAAQGKATEAIVEARAAGDKAGARTAAKEIAERARASAHGVNGTPAAASSAKNGAAGKTNGVAHHPPVVRGPQPGLFDKDKPADTKPDKVEPKIVAPSKAVLEDMLALATKKPPTHDYVKGIMEGVRFALGFTNPDKFASPWVTYLAHVEGKAKPRKGGGRKSDGKKAKKVAKAKAKKPTAKNAKKGGKKAKR